MLKACAKAVQTVGKACWQTVGVRPQSLRISMVSPRNYSENTLFVPELSHVYAQTNPQLKSMFSYLLTNHFSTLSTQPITTTTNLKTKKGNN